MDITKAAAEVGSMVGMSAISYAALSIGTSLNPAVGIIWGVSRKIMALPFSYIPIKNDKVKFVSRLIATAAMVSCVSNALSIPITFLASLLVPFKIVLLLAGGGLAAVGVAAISAIALYHLGIIKDSHIAYASSLLIAVSLPEHVQKILLDAEAAVDRESLESGAARVPFVPFSPLPD